MFVGRHGTHIVFNVFALYINIYDGSSHRNKVLVDLFFSFTSIFDLFTRSSQQKKELLVYKSSFQTEDKVPKGALFFCKKRGNVLD